MMHFYRAIFIATYFTLYFLGAQASTHGRSGEAGPSRNHDLSREGIASTSLHRRASDPLGVRDASIAHGWARTGLNERREKNIHPIDSQRYLNGARSSPTTDVDPLKYLQIKRTYLKALRRRSAMNYGTVAYRWHDVNRQSDDSSDDNAGDRPSRPGLYDQPIDRPRKHRSSKKKDRTSNRDEHSASGTSRVTSPKGSAILDMYGSGSSLSSSESGQETRLSRASTSSASLADGVVNHWLPIGQQLKKVHVTGICSFTGLFIWVKDRGLLGVHIDQTKIASSVHQAIDNQLNAHLEGAPAMSAYIFAPTKEDAEKVKTTISIHHPQTSMKVKIYESTRRRGFWEFTGDVDNGKASKRWIRGKEWNPDVETEGVRVS